MLRQREANALDKILSHFHTRSVLDLRSKTESASQSGSHLVQVQNQSQSQTLGEKNLKPYLTVDLEVGQTQQENQQSFNSQIEV